MSSGWERIANAMNVRATLVCGWLVRNRTDADLTAIAIGADGAGAQARGAVGRVVGVGWRNRCRDLSETWIRRCTVLE